MEGQRYDQSIQVYVTAEQKQALAEKAARMGLTVGVYARTVLLRELNGEGEQK